MTRAQLGSSSHHRSGSGAGVPERESAVARTRSEKTCLPNPSVVTVRPRSAGHRPSAPARGHNPRRRGGRPRSRTEDRPARERRAEQPVARAPKAAYDQRDVRPARKPHTRPDRAEWPSRSARDNSKRGVHQECAGHRRQPGRPASPGSATTVRIAENVPSAPPGSSDPSGISSCASSAGICPSVSSDGINRSVSSGGTNRSSVDTERSSAGSAPALRASRIARSASSVRTGPETDPAGSSRAHRAGEPDRPSSGSRPVTSPVSASRRRWSRRSGPGGSPTPSRSRPPPSPTHSPGATCSAAARPAPARRSPSACR